MYTFAVGIASPVVGRDEQHRDCACVGLVIALPDGALHLFAEGVEDLESLGWGILSAVDEIKKAPAPAARTVEVADHG